MIDPTLLVPLLKSTHFWNAPWPVVRGDNEAG